MRSYPHGSLMRALVIKMRALLWEPNQLPKDPPLHSLGTRASTHEFWREKYQSSELPSLIPCTFIPRHPVVSSPFLTTQYLSWINIHLTFKNSLKWFQTLCWNNRADIVEASSQRANAYVMALTSPFPCLLAWKIAFLWSFCIRKVQEVTSQFSYFHFSVSHQHPVPCCLELSWCIHTTC